MKKLKVLDLFSGIGGFSLGLERTGGCETVAFCEIEPFQQNVLKKHWPSVEIFENVTNIKLKAHVDLVTAGFPCQDISLAGEGAGLSGKRSGLFWYILRTACLVGRPKLLLENVAALLNRGLCTVLGALASFGYDAEWDCVSPEAIGFPSNRDRVWIYSYPQEINVQKMVVQRRLSLKFGGVGPPGVSRIGWRLDKRRMGRGVDGLPDRVDRFEGLGNTVYPGIPEIYGRGILESEIL